MTDVLTTVFGFVKQTIGGSRNTWGGILNANFDKVEAGLAGQLDKALTGGSVSLTDSERRNRILNFSGTLTSNATVVIANVPGVWLVQNNTAGAFSLSLKTADGAAVAVPQGGWNLVWCDGDDTVYVGPSTLLFTSQFKGPDGTLPLPGLSYLSEPTLGVRRAGYAAGNLSADPFTTQNGSAVVTVAHNAHGLASGEFASYSGATAVGGITISGLYPVTVVNANSYTITHSAVATSNATGGGTPAYKYMKASVSGGALALTVAGADVAHVSPYGVIFTGAFYASGAGRFGGALIGGGAATFAGLLTAAGATLSALLAGTAATLSGLLTLSSTSHWLPVRGTTAQRPTGDDKVQGATRYNTTDDIPEWADVAGNWRRPSIAQPIAGNYKNLVVKNNDVTPNSKIDIDADAVIVETDAGVAFRLTGIDITIDCGAANGANALDTGGLANGKWVYPFVIYNPTTNVVAGLASLSATAPAMPDGYTAKMRAGAFPTNGSAQLKRIKQRGNRAQYAVGASSSIIPSIANGVAGTYDSSNPALASVTVTGDDKVAPPTAIAIRVNAYNKWKGLNFARLMVAPSSAWGYGSGSGPIGADGLTWPIVLDNSVAVAVQATIILEGTAIGWACDATGGAISCMGWDDNI